MSKHAFDEIEPEDLERLARALIDTEHRAAGTLTRLGDDPDGASLLEALRAAIDALPFLLRSALVQRYLEGLDYEQIARDHDITVATARERCQLARDRIAQALRVMSPS